MKVFLYDKSPERAHAVHVCELKLCKAFDNYCGILCNYDNPGASESAKKYHDECVWRWQDLESLRYDPKDKWDLNYNDYEEEIITEYYPSDN